MGSAADLGILVAGLVGHVRFRLVCGVLDMGISTAGLSWRPSCALCRTGISVLVVKVSPGLHFAVSWTWVWKASTLVSCS